MADSPYDYLTYNGVTPDPNDPNSPNIIVVLDEDDIPYAFRKIEDKDDKDNMIYEEDPTIPL